jgi:hypothetical protein
MRSTTQSGELISSNDLFSSANITTSNLQSGININIRSSDSDFTENKFALS